MAYLTKSKFKLALECPTKMYYASHKEYANSKEVDPFLEALAEGGFQVGELAKYYHDGGVMVDTLDIEEAISITNKLLENENVTIYEAAIRYNNMVVRVDILVKEGNTIKIKEVKSKSCDFTNSKGFISASGFVESSWKPYIYDITYQYFVATKFFSTMVIIPYLTLANKLSTTSVSGLNQKFRLNMVDGRKSVTVSPDTNPTTIGDKILIDIDVSDIVIDVIKGNAFKEQLPLPFPDYVYHLSKYMEDDEAIQGNVGIKCLRCEYDCSLDSGMKSGKRECFGASIPDFDFDRPSINTIWNYRKKQAVWDSGRYYADQMVNEDFVSGKKNEMTPTASRQWLQVRKMKNRDNTPHIEHDMMKETLRKHKYPLHFIDFETSRTAIPFCENMRPYEQVAFQFSHHVMHDDGRVEHAGEFINMERGAFPNFHFARELKRQLSADDGTIFKYATHENSVLNDIKGQLYCSDEPDKDELINFINTITNHKDEDGKVVAGERDMVDMCDMVKKMYYDVRMGGSNSIKAVLPSVLESSEFLKSKYSAPIYGKNSPIRSTNFDDGWVWVQTSDDGNVKNPYKLLPSIYPVQDGEEDSGEDINNGGAAMTAYAQMQFSEVSDEQFDAMKNALLRYCELDTLAMVMIYECWKDMVGL